MKANLGVRCFMKANIILFQSDYKPLFKINAKLIYRNLSYKFCHTQH